MAAATPMLDAKTIRDGAAIISYAPNDALTLSYLDFAKGWVDAYNETATDPEVDLPAFRLVATVPEPIPATGDVTSDEFLVGHVCSTDELQVSMVLIKDIGGRHIRLMCRQPKGDELERCSVPA